MTRGRPSLNKLLEKLLHEVIVLHKDMGSFPPSIEANEIWKDIWLEETHHSTALEGNTLNSKEVYNLVEEGLTTSHKEIRHHHEVQGYSIAAKWVYEKAIEDNKNHVRSISMQHIKHIHNLLVNLVWTAYPPASGDKPGKFRESPVKIRGSKIVPPPWGDVPELMENLLNEINNGPGDNFVIWWVSEIHAKFEAIHPFADGNGRTGRLLMNYLLIMHGYPPAIILKSQRGKYLRALERAQGKNEDYTMLAELIARAVRDNLNKLLLPSLSKDNDLIPLSAVAEGTPYKPSYLRRLAQEGKLKAIREDYLWLSSKKWLQEYIDNRSPRGRKN